MKAFLAGSLLGSPASASLAGDSGKPTESPFGRSTKSAADAVAQQCMKGTLNVRDLGAVGNGIADDTSALRTALARAKRTGRTVYLPAGRYLITDTLELSNEYSPSQRELENDVIALSLVGDGSHATYILWGSRIPITTARKPMLFMQGFIALRRLTLMGIRPYFGAQYHTPYYGIVGHGTLWKNSIEDVNIKNACICFSSAVVASSRAQGPYGIEMEPPANGSPLSTDFAQIQFRNCVFWSEVPELFDGSLGSASVLDARARRILEASASFEAGHQQSVNLVLDSCVLKNNNRQASCTVRLADVGDIAFRDTLLAAPPVVSGHTYSIVERSDSGGSNVYLDHCYFDGGIARMKTSQGILRIRNCNGENVTEDVAHNGEVDLLLIEGFGTTVDVDGLDIGRGNFRRKLTLSTAVQQSSATTNPALDTSYTHSRRLYALRNITGVAQIQCGHEIFVPSARLDSTPSLLPDYALEADFLSSSSSLPSNASSSLNYVLGFSSRVQLSGRWLLQAVMDKPNELSYIVAIDPATCFDFSVDVHIKLVSGQRVPVGELAVALTFHDTREKLLTSGAGSGVFLLGGVTPANGNDALENGQTITLYSQHIVPPAGAAYARVLLQATPSARHYLAVAMGNARLGPAGSNLILSKYPTLRIRRLSAPAS
ncbi:hypothetical protein CR51_00075 [Caballeronia megalochromosomata]|nr:hypothetical protein CR51_00075 [Caballeronia megalochromosomata]